MAKVTNPAAETASRKNDHIRINLEEDVQSGLTTGLERYAFVHQAVPELNLAEIDTAGSWFGKTVRTPILISSMTGGTEEARVLNHKLAEAAQHLGLAMGVGSQRAAIENPALAATFQVRAIAPDIVLLANLGAVQLNYGYGIEQCRRAVEMIEADALILHLNAVQEAVQPEGDGNFAGLLHKIEGVCRALPVPVVAKEVGWGFSEQAARQLANAGVAAIDVAGAGGTSWSQVEMYRAKTPAQRQIAAAFINWGIPTSTAIRNVRQAAPQLPIIASGGLQSGMDIAKCIALGAGLGGLAGPFLKAAAISTEAVIDAANLIARELRITMFAAGAKDLAALQATPLIERTA